MIDGQAPAPQELPGGYKRRVVVKFRPDVRLPYTTEAQTQFANTASREWTELTASPRHRARALLLHAARAHPALVIAIADAATRSRSTQFYSILCHRMSCRSGP